MIADRPPLPQLLFVFGCPRSGTTWVQLLLDRHPEVVTAPETHVFSFYLNQFRRQWEHEITGTGDRAQGKAGLSQLLSRDEFDQVCRQTAEQILSHIARRDPGASVVMEKSPQHALHAEWIGGLFPDARFLHVIRDPRDTVSSLQSAAWSWGRNWAPANPIDAARYWVTHVRGAQALRGRERYREVRFEALKDDTERELSAILEWLDLRRDERLCREAVEACRLEKLRDRKRRDLPTPGSRTPPGFFRKGLSGGWREELSTRDVRIVEGICGEIMDTLGYTRSAPPGRSAGAWILIHDAIQRVRESVDWQFRRLLRRV